MTDLGEPGITWAERLANLRAALGREPTLAEMLEAASIHSMTPDELQAQRESWSRANVSTGDRRFD